MSATSMIGFVAQGAGVSSAREKPRYSARGAPAEGWSDVRPRSKTRSVSFAPVPRDIPEERNIPAGSHTEFLEKKHSSISGARKNQYDVHKVAAACKGGDFNQEDYGGKSSFGGTHGDIRGGSLTHMVKKRAGINGAGNDDIHSAASACEGGDSDQEDNSGHSSCGANRADSCGGLSTHTAKESGSGQSRYRGDRGCSHADSPPYMAQTLDVMPQLTPRRRQTTGRGASVPGGALRRSPAVDDGARLPTLGSATPRTTEPALRWRPRFADKLREFEEKNKELASVVGSSRPLKPKMKLRPISPLDATGHGSQAPSNFADAEGENDTTISSREVSMSPMPWAMQDVLMGIPAKPAGPRPSGLPLRVQHITA